MSPNILQCYTIELLLSGLLTHVRGSNPVTSGAEKMSQFSTTDKHILTSTCTLSTEVQNSRHMCRRTLISGWGKWPTCVLAIQCWKDSGSAMEQFQRKSHKILPLIVHQVSFVCRANKPTTSKFKPGQSNSQPNPTPIPRCACMPRVTTAFKAQPL